MRLLRATVLAFSGVLAYGCLLPDLAVDEPGAGSSSSATPSRTNPLEPPGVSPGNGGEGLPAEVPLSGARALPGIGRRCGVAGAVCDAALVCVDGLCRQPCDSAEDCALGDGAAACRPGTGTNGSPLSACALVCDPVASSSAALLACPDGFVCAADVEGAQQSPGATDCVAEERACDPASQACPTLCFADSDCPGTTCVRFSPARFAGSRELGVCSTPCDPVSPQAPRAGLTACSEGFGCRAVEGGGSVCQAQPSSNAVGAACLSDRDCGPSFFCGNSGTCRRYCASAADCGGEETCSPFAPVRRASGVSVGFCSTPFCDPVRPQQPRDGLASCPVNTACNSTQAALQPTSCVAQSGEAIQYERCIETSECAPGHFCGGGGIAGMCSRYCIDDSDCPGERCKRFGTPEFSGGLEVGFCGRQCNVVDPQSGQAPFSACQSGLGCNAGSDDGLSFCTVSGPGRVYDRCESSQDCSPGLFCSLGACRERCRVGQNDCTRGECGSPETPTVVAGVNFGACHDGCDPANPQSNTPPFSACASGMGCSEGTAGLSFCYGAGTGARQALCEASTDCGSGLFCNVLGTCREYCRVGQGDCGVGTCVSFSPQSLIDGVEFGACTDQCNPTNAQSSTAPFSPCAPGLACQSGSAPGASTCRAVGTGRHLAACEASNDCAAGFFCDATVDQCRQYCFDDDDCDSGSCSIAFNTPTFGGDDELSICTNP